MIHLGMYKMKIGQLETGKFIVFRESHWGREYLTCPEKIWILGEDRDIHLLCSFPNLQAAKEAKNSLRPPTILQVIEE